MLQLQKVMGEVYAKEASHALMVLLVEANAPVRYSVARRNLNLKPELFHRAVKSLERLAFIGRIVEPESEDRYSVFLEPTVTGRRIVELWHKLEAEARRDRALESMVEESREASSSAVTVPASWRD